MKIPLKPLILLTFLFMLSGCGTAYYSDENEFYKGQQSRVIADPVSYIKVCGDFFTKKQYIEALAYQYCSKTNTVPVFVTKRYYQDCSLFDPIAYVYNCRTVSAK